MTDIAFRPPADPAPARVRCAESIRTQRGYEMCHRDEHELDTPHHVRDRSWYGGRSPRLQLGRPCGEACRWPDQVTPYLGGSPRT